MKTILLIKLKIQIIFHLSFFNFFVLSLNNDCPLLDGNLDGLTQELFIGKLTDSCRYDKLTKPPTDHPLPVFIQLDLSHIESIDQIQFKAKILVQYRYHDIRLKFNKLSPNRGAILGEEQLRDKIWVPHLFIRNERDTAIMGIDRKDIFISINPQGNVVYSYRLTATFYCWMNLKKFPFDTQECELKWTSWTYNMTHLILHWDDVPVKVAKNLHLTEFLLNGNWTEERQVPAAFQKGIFVGQYSELIFKFKLRREVGYYIMDYFLPSILLVCTSWVTFWLQADASPARTALGTSTMLAFITLNGGLTKNLPKVSYIKASEIWFLGCACFIFGSMAEFAFVNVIWRRRKIIELKKYNSKHILLGALTPSIARKQLRKAESLNCLYKPQSFDSLASNNRNYLSVDGLSKYKINYPYETQNNITNITVTEQETTPQWSTMSPHEVSNWIDRKSRIFFPISFLIFNIFYWTFVYIF